MNKHLIYLELIFLVAVILNLFVPDMLTLKILFLLLTFLFFIKELDAFTYNRAKYKYVGIGFTSILFLFILAQYITHIYFLVFFMCAVILYLYLYKVLFNTTFGVVIKSLATTITVKITDPFFKTKKEYILKCFKKPKLNSIIILNLSKSFVDKKPISVKQIIIEK